MSSILKKENTIYIAFFVFLLLLCFLFPYTNDDWTWGSSMGLNLLFSGFDNYNGRWVGNILAIILTRSTILKTIVMAAVLTGIVILICKIVNKKNFLLPFLAIPLILGMKSGIWSQGFAWTSGFVNYSVSIFLILIYVYLNKNLFSKEKINFTYKSVIPLTFLGFSLSLIMENITIYNIILAISILIFTYTKQKKIFVSQICYLIGSIAGTILMFSNSAYLSIFNNTDSYRSVASNGIFDTAFTNYFNVITNNLLFKNIILIIAISILILLIVKKIKHKTKVQSIIALIIFLYPLYSLLTCIFPSWQPLLKYTIYFNGLVTFLYAISLLIFPIIFIKDKYKKNRLIFIILSIGLITGVLLFVSPVGFRNFFPTYILLVLYAICLFEEIEIKKINVNYIKRGLSIFSVVLGLYLLSIYAYVFKCDIERTNSVKEAVQNNNKIIYFEGLPYNDYVWLSSPLNEKIEYEIKYFYDIPFSTKVISVPYGYEKK